MQTKRMVATIVLAMVALLLVAGTALAASPHGGRPLETTMTGAAERPGPGDPDGSGAAKFTLNQGQGEICYQLSVSGITLPATAAHIHVAPPSDPGPVVVPLNAPAFNLLGAGRHHLLGKYLQPVLKKELLSADAPAH